MIRDPRTYRIIGCAMAVHRKLGPGFLEAVYADALEIEFGSQGISFQREVPFAIAYEGEVLRSQYRADFVCYGEVLVELKAQSDFGLPQSAPVVNYLRASGLGVGLLLNFAQASLEYRRCVFTHRPPTKSAASRSTPGFAPRSMAKPAIL